MANSVRRIRIVNPNLNDSEKTQLDTDYTGGVALTVISNFGFQNDDIVVVGTPGTEKAEASDVTGTTGNTQVNISAALKFNHQAGTPIFRSEFDQVEISTNSGAGWNVLDTVGIKWDNQETIYIHQGGTDSHSYRFRFKNSVSGNTSEYSPTIVGSGAPKNSVGYRIEKIRLAVNDPDRKIVTDQEIMGYLTVAKDIVRASRSDWWFWLKEDLGTITTTAGTNKYDLDTISDRIEFVRDMRIMNTSVPNGTSLYQLMYKTPVEFDEMVRDQTQTDNDDVEYYTILPPDGSSSSGYIAVYPTPLTTNKGAFYLRYYEPDADYDDVADTISIPLPNILDLFAIAQIEYVKGNDARASIFEKLFNGSASANRDRSQLTGLALLEQMQINRLRPVGQPMSLKSFKGRNPLKRFYGSRSYTNRDSLVERYFNPRG